MVQGTVHEIHNFLKVEGVEDSDTSIFSHKSKERYLCHKSLQGGGGIEKFEI